MLLAFLLAVRLAPPAPEIQYRQPQLGVGKGVVAVAFGAGTTIHVSISHDGAASFSKPVKVAEVPKLMLGRHRGPRIAISGGAFVISAIGESGDLLSWRSSDGGRTWTPGPHINDAAGSAREGLHAMAAGPGGFLFAAWLDLRAGRTRLVGARSTDGGRTWSANTEIYASPDGSICECCHPSAAIDSRGTVYVMWRNWLSGARDMYLSRSLDGKTFSPAQKLGEGTWPLNACPMDGGGLAVSPEVITVWRRDGAVFSSRPGFPETPLGKGKDPAFAGGYAVWSSGRALMVKSAGDPEPRMLAAEGAYAALAGAGPVYAAWESGGEIVVDKLAPQ